MFSGRTRSNIEWHRGQGNLDWIDEQLMQRCHRALSVTSDPLERLQLLCLTRGAVGILRLGRVLRKFDDNGRKRIYKEDFDNALQECGIHLGERDTEELFDRFDIEGLGSVTVDEIIKEIRPPLTECRLQILEKAFKKLDKDQDGKITEDDLHREYSVEGNLRYKSGEETKEQIMDAFVKNFENTDSIDGKITFEEFVNYYSGISASIDKDCTFDLMLREAYKL